MPGGVLVVFLVRKDDVAEILVAYPRGNAIAPPEQNIAVVESEGLPQFASHRRLLLAGLRDDLGFS
jgi:hypothetical protein